MKKLSIVTTTYKSEKYLDAYFQNICALDDFSNYQIVLVLNDPNEQELRIVDSYKKKYPENILTTQVPREPIAVSTNRGFALAEAEYLTIADVDDIRVKDCCFRQMKTLENNFSASYTYGDFVIVPKQGETKGLLVKTQEFSKELAVRNSIVGPNHFFRKKILEKCGMWDEQLKSGSDFDFQVRAAFNAVFKKTSGEPLLYYTRYEGSNSASTGRIQQIERTVIQLRYGIYDKINYDFLPEALKYDIFHIYSQGEKKHVSEFVPNYDKYMEESRNRYLKKGIRKNFVNLLLLEKTSFVLKSFLKNPIWTTKKIITKIRK